MVSAFGQSNNTLVYLQNNGFLNGNVLNSVILSCKLNRDNTESLVKRITSFVERNHVTYPIFWNEIMSNDIKFYKNTEGEMIGNEFKNKCILLSQLKFQGPHLYGGKNGDTFFQKPNIKFDVLPINLPKKTYIVTSVCKFDGKHQCDIQTRKGNVNDIKKYQNIIAQMVANRELESWKSETCRNKGEILLHLSKIKEGIENETM